MLPRGFRRLAKWGARRFGAAPPAGVCVADLEMDADALDVARAKAIYEEFGCLVVRGLNLGYVDKIQSHADEISTQSSKLLDGGQAREQISEASGQLLGWLTPDQTLWVPAPAGHVRDKQIMVLGLDYFNSSALFEAATASHTLDLVEHFLGSGDIELFGKGQCFYKEGGLGGGAGSNPKLLHQDSAYFMFAKQGACATLNYACDTSVALDNGPLYVIPGSHREGHIEHIDTASHLGLDEKWSFDKAIPVDGKASPTAC